MLLRRDAVPVDRLRDDVVDLHELRVVHDIRRLQPAQLDDLVRQAGEAVRLDGQPFREALDLFGFGCRRLERLCEQTHRADRRLQLVADVGDEVAPHLFESDRLRAVLREHEHEPGAQPGDADAEMQFGTPEGAA